MGSDQPSEYDPLPSGQPNPLNLPQDIIQNEPKAIRAVGHDLGIETFPQDHDDEDLNNLEVKGWAGVNHWKFRAPVRPKADKAKKEEKKLKQRKKRHF